MSIDRLTLSVCVLTLLGASAAYSQDYPNKPIRIYAGSAGSGSDLFARLIANEITGPLGQPVIIDNRAVVVAVETAAKAAPDGYSLLWGGTGTIVRPLLLKVAYDPVRDFSPIAEVAIEPSIVVVHPSLPVKNIKELIVLAKARPGELNYGSSGSPGGSVHLASELFKSMAGVNIVQVNYKGGNPMAFNGLRSGEVQLIFAGVYAVPAVKAGQVRALAVTSSKPSALFPGLPTVAASGLPGYEIVSRDFLLAAGKPPAAIINRLNRETVRALNSPGLKEKFFAEGAEVTGSTPEELATRMSADMTSMGKVIKDAGIKGE